MWLEEIPLTLPSPAAKPGGEGGRTLFSFWLRLAGAPTSKRTTPPESPCFTLFTHILYRCSCRRCAPTARVWLGQRIRPFPPCRSQLTSLRELPNDHLDFQSLREARRRLGAHARAGTGKLSHHLHNHHYHNHLHHRHNHHTNRLCEDLAHTPQVTADQEDASGKPSRLRRPCAEKFGSEFGSELEFAVCRQRGPGRCTARRRWQLRLWGIC